MATAGCRSGVRRCERSIPVPRCARLGLLAQAEGDIFSAERLFEEAAVLARETGDQLQLNSRDRPARRRIDHLRPVRARSPLFAENESRWDEQRKWTWMGHASFHLGLIALGRGQEADAASRFADAIVAYDRGNSPLYAVDALQYLGLIRLKNDDTARAAQSFEEALNRLELRKSSPDLAMGIANVAALAARSNRSAESVALFASAQAAREAAGLPLPEPAASIYESFRSRAMSSSARARPAKLSPQVSGLPLDQALDAARTILQGGEVVLTAEPAGGFGLTERGIRCPEIIGRRQDSNDEIAARFSSATAPPEPTSPTSSASSTPTPA